MDHDVAPQEDYRHPLDAGEHEAFHFLFTARDGSVFGYARLLFGHADVLEVLALRVAGETWVSQRRHPAPPLSDIRGEHLALTCRRPWEHWHLAFDGQATEVSTGAQRPLTFTATFQAATPPKRYRFGAHFQQVYQDGDYQVQMHLGAEHWAGVGCGARDHTWGRRPMSAVRNCTVLTIPRRLFTVIADTDLQPACFGHWIAAGQVTPVSNPQLHATESGWRLEDAAVDSGIWQAQPLAEPLVVYYGVAGEEEVRAAPRAGDLLRDTIIPASFTSPEGESFTGFVDLLRGIHDD